MQSGISIPQSMEYSIYSHNSFIQYAEAQHLDPFIHRGKTFEDIDFKNGTHKQTLGLPVYIESGETETNSGLFGHSQKFIPYILTNSTNSVKYETGSVSWIFDKPTCSFKLFNGGKINSVDDAVIESVSLTMQEEISPGVWQNTVHNGMACNVSVNELPDNKIQLIARQGNATIQYKEIRFEQIAGLDLEVWLKTPNATFNGQKFGWAESHVKSQDIDVKGQKFDVNLGQEKKFLKSEMVDNTDGKKHDFAVVTENTKGRIIFNHKDSIHNTLTDVTIKKYQSDKLQTVYNYHNASPLQIGQSLEIDPSYSSNNPTVDGWVRTASTTGTSCPTTTNLKDTTSTTAEVHIGSTSDTTCARTFVEWDITSISDSATITDVDYSWDIASVTNGINCDYNEMNTQPSAGGTTNQQIWNDIGDGTTFVSNDSNCASSGDNKSLDLGSSADADVQAQLSANWWALGVKFNSEVRDASFHSSNTSTEEGSSTPNPTLDVVYSVSCTPDAPTGLGTGSYSTTGMTVSWTAPTNCTMTTTEVQRSTSGAFAGEETTIYSSTPKTSHADSGLSSGTKYWYRVRYQSDSGDWGSYVTSSSYAQTLFGAPTSLSFSGQTTSSITISWSAPSGNGVITGYKVERSTDNSSWSTVIADTGSSTTSYTNNSGLSSGTLYYYRISAINASGTGTASSSSSTYTVPSAPTSLSAIGSSETSIDLSWSAPSGTVTGYKIERESPVGGGFSTIVSNTGTTLTTYSDTGLSLGTQYNYRVSAINVGGTSSASNTSAAYTITTYSTPPTGLVASTNSSATKIYLDWTAGSMTNKNGYRIERENGIGAGWTTIVSNTTNTLTHYTSPVLTPGIDYNWRVRALNASGVSSPSNEDDSYPFKRPYAITTLSYSSSGFSTIELSWTAPTAFAPIQGYRINYTSPVGNPIIIFTNNTNSTATTYTVYNLIIGGNYSFRVSPITQFGFNSSGNIVNATTFSNYEPGNLAIPSDANTNDMQIFFERDPKNSTAEFLNVTYADTYNLKCNFNYKFAQVSRNYTGLNYTVIDSDNVESSFLLNGTSRDIITVRCWDQNNYNHTAAYVITQTDFPLLQQIANFRNGTYGTHGFFGAIDGITLFIIILGMIGFNRVNNAAGIVFVVIATGASAYFGIIQWWAVVFPAIAVIVVLAITSTRKDD